MYILFHKKEENDYKLSIININDNVKTSLNDLNNNDTFKEYITNNNYNNILTKLE